MGFWCDEKGGRRKQIGREPALKAQENFKK
jgi:hypothetical protein